MNNIIDTQELKKSFSINKKEKEQVIRGINFSVTENEFISIVGPSGSGKSTFLYCISGLVQADSGHSFLCGVDLVTASKNQRSDIRRKNASFVFQDYNLVDSMTALENVQLGLRFVSKKIAKKELNNLFEKFGLAERKNYYPAQLSGGQRQRVAIIRALATKPRVLFADEPTGALDSRSGSLVMNELAELSRQGAAVVMVTHDLEVAAQAQRAVVLSDGRLIKNLENPTRQELFQALDANNGNEEKL
ncbi:ABC transporter ATP-binding protein [Corynebacterium pseudodiphtheriticum]|uniref:ABC transporter ATP-binding protein n=1 Tax=Corynebacterium pseudodiphtheriticum TaxID=37637 RepID=UPI00254C4F94|nr:ABC transporter ATP-binding protein [Corynebacterium pseudodiphtheriticum]MDK8762004.1 ABC transporter ATP-binding protein [Corynebacterium pseudodiphtheriticum]